MNGHEHRHPPVNEFDPSLLRDLQDSMLNKAARAPAYTDLYDTGTILAERYNILRLIGQGGMGAVYLAYDLKLQRQVAIKVMHARSDEVMLNESKETQRIRIKREAQALAQLSHQHVIAVYDLDIHEGKLFISMEHIDGNNLTQWKQKEKPNKNEILNVLLAAGEGLAAAHRVGIIHLDFKPSNVIIGHDGKIKVADFGLARATDRDEKPTQHCFDSVDKCDNLLSDKLTQTGYAIGTPAYMAPEQGKHEKLGTWTDQFSFCLVAWEMLCGERPYPVDSIKFWKNMTSPSADMKTKYIGEKKIPTWLKKNLLKGLAFHPQDRFASMLDLLKQMRKSPAKALQHSLTLLLIMILVGMGVYGLSLSIMYRAKLCRDGTSKAAIVWNERTKNTIEASFVSSGHHRAVETYQRVAEILDDWSLQWAGAYTDACNATHKEGSQSEEVLDRRMRCLDRKLMSMGELTKAFSEKPDSMLVNRAVNASLGLGGVAICADIEALSQDIVPPENPVTRKAVEELRRKLENIRHFNELGKHKKAKKILDALQPQASTLPYKPIQAELILAQGINEAYMGKYKKAESALLEALQSGLYLSNKNLALEAAHELTYLVGYQQKNFSAGLVYAEMALGLSRGMQDERDARSRANLGDIYLSQGNSEKATEQYKAALLLLEKTHGLNNPHMIKSITAIGVALANRAQYDKAEKEHRRAIEITERVFGPEHPTIANLCTNLGSVLSYQGRYPEAEAEHKRAIDVTERAFGPKHPTLAIYRGNLGNVLYKRSKYKEAEAEQRLAVKISAISHNPENPDLARYRANLGITLYNQKKYPEAEVEYKHAINSLQKAYGHDHPHVAWVHNCLGNLYLKTKNIQKAKDCFHQANAICKRLFCDPNTKADSLWSLAKILWAERNYPAKALELARQARQIFAKEPGLKGNLDEINRFLDDRVIHEK